MDEIIEKNYIENRILNQKNYYGKKCKIKQRRFAILSIISIIVTSTIPIIALLDFIPYKESITAISGAVSTILSSLIFFFRDKETWIQYRATSEKIKSELYKYQSKTEKYFDMQDNEAFNLFVTTCEEIMGNQNEQWVKEKLSKNSANSSS
ncbi:MAG: DUF4231 domain-containing protein [Ruminococcus sp.]|nr:DUF4231 domain-containing protein [Ruminococcus sp.]